MKPTNFTAWLEGFLEGTASTKANLNNYDLDTIKKKLDEVDLNTDINTLSAKFCLSLQGVLEIENPSSFSDIQVEKIKNKLADANAEIAEQKGHSLPITKPPGHSGGGHTQYRC